MYTSFKILHATSQYYKIIDNVYKAIKGIKILIKCKKP